MTRLIFKLFIDSAKASDRRLRIGVVGGMCGIALNLLTALFKAAVGVLFSSIALIADAVNNITDAASSVITLFGFKLAAKKPDKDHPYGHGRIEYISGLIMAFIVLLLGLTLIKTSIERIITPEKIVFSYLSIIVLIVSIIAKLWLSVFYKRLEKETESKTFAAAAADSRNDMISTAAVLVSVVFFAITGINIDGYIGLAVSVFIVVSGIGLIRDTLDPLLGQPPSKEFVDTIYSRAMKHDGIIGIHDLVVHNYGPGRIFASFHAEVDAKENLLKSHDMADNIEREFYNDLGIEVVVHIDPIVTDDPAVDTFKKYITDILAGIDRSLTIHDFRAVTGFTHTNLIFDIVTPMEFHLSDSEIKAIIDKKLHEKEPNCFTVITFDKSMI